MSDRNINQFAAGRPNATSVYIAASISSSARPTFPAARACVARAKRRAACTRNESEASTDAFPKHTGS
jgi:hypothetical protein